MQKNLISFIIPLLLMGCAPKTKTQSIESSAVKVKVQSVRLVSGDSNLRYSGTVEAEQTIPLTFQSSGTVDKVLVQEGDQVRKGQLLAVVNKVDNQSIYNSALATFQQAKDSYDRLKQVYDNGSLSEVKWIEMETNLKRAESQMQIAKNNLDKCNLYAPVSGVVGKRNIEPGQSSISGFAPLELVKIERVLIKISVPENEIGKIKKGMTASFVISALDNRQAVGTISHVGVVADQFSRTYEVKIMVNNSDLSIKPGMVCDVILDSGSGKKTILVPYSAVTKDSEGNSYLFLADPVSRRAQKQIVKVGKYNASGLEILSGVLPNQTVVVEGKEKLSNNSPISL